MRRFIIPAILAYSAEEFADKLRFIEKHFKMLQLDVLDGTMGIKNTSFFDLKTIKKLRPKTDLELHLMVDRPEGILADWLAYSKLKRVVIHYESFAKRKKDLYDIIEMLSKEKMKIGLAINPNTTVSKILEFLPNIDLLLVMGVNPGWSGQKFIPGVFQKIRDVRKHYPKLNIGVDGGVTQENYRMILDAGANVLYAASMVYQFKDKPNELKKLLKRIRL